LGLGSWVLGLGSLLSTKTKVLRPKTYSSYLLNNNAAFVPPNPKLFEST
jgi:hypothetical protein